MRHFYGVDTIDFAGIVGDGRGQTIAIVDAYDDPNAASDLQHFDSFYSLPSPPSFLQYNENGQLLAESGGTGVAPTAGPSGNGWQIEESLDIEWAHVIAPAANIALIECNSTNFSNPPDLFNGVAAAASIPNVVCVSMSWGSNGEFSGEGSSDSTFTAGGITYLAATGDGGEASTSYPAASSNVVAVGGTTISVVNGTETAWNGTGGEISPYESKPSYQNAVLSGSFRGTPDVSMDANPNTGVAIYDSYDFGSSNAWAQYGGTSLSSPMWAALIAIADQGRAGAGLGALSGRSQTLPDLYTAPSADFHDVTSGSNGAGNSARVGYDTVTGIGTPVANMLLNTLSGVTATNHLAFTQPPSATVAGVAIDGPGGVQVTVENPLGNPITTDSSTVTLQLNGGTFSTGGSTATATAMNGVATFPSLVIDTVGNYTITASDGSLTPITSSSFSVTPAATSSLVFLVGPTNTTAGSAISPAVTVQLKDQFGNIATNDNSMITMTVPSGPGALTGTMVAQASNGVATFANLILDLAGTYTLQPTEGPVSGAISSSFVVNSAAAAALSFTQQPGNTATGNPISPAVKVSVQDGFGNAITSASTVTLTLHTGVFSGGSTTVSAPTVNGVATFNGLVINSAGSYVLTATDAPAAAVNSNSFSVSLVDVAALDNSSDSMSLRQDADGQHIDWTFGATNGSVPINDPNGLTINGNADNDTITLDYSNGNPIPNTLHLNGTFTINGIQGANPLAGTTLDIGKSTVYVKYSSSDPIGTIRSYLLNGYNNGPWNGKPITSTGVITSAAAQANSGYMIGYADSADGVVLGQPANTIELKYTIGGDLNLTGTVTFADFAKVVSDYNKPAYWDGGAITYEPDVSFTDFAMVVANYGRQAVTSAVSAPAVPTLAADPSQQQPAQPANLNLVDTVPVNSAQAQVDTKPAPRSRHR